MCHSRRKDGKGGFGVVFSLMKAMLAPVMSKSSPVPLWQLAWSSSHSSDTVVPRDPVVGGNEGTV